MMSEYAAIVFKIYREYDLALLRDSNDDRLKWRHRTLDDDEEGMRSILDFHHSAFKTLDEFDRHIKVQHKIIGLQMTDKFSDSILSSMGVGCKLEIPKVEQE